MQKINQSEEPFFDTENVKGFKTFKLKCEKLKGGKEKE